MRPLSKRTADEEDEGASLDEEVQDEREESESELEDRGERDVPYNPLSARTLEGPQEAASHNATDRKARDDDMLVAWVQAWMVRGEWQGVTPRKEKRGSVWFGGTCQATGEIKKNTASQYVQGESSQMLVADWEDEGQG